MGPSTCKACSATYAASAPYERSTSWCGPAWTMTASSASGMTLRGDPADERDPAAAGTNTVASPFSSANSSVA